MGLSEGLIGYGESRDTPFDEALYKLAMAVNELRQDVASGDWVLISSLRAKRPHSPDHERLSQAIEECVFEPRSFHEQHEPILLYNQGMPVVWSGDWSSPWTTVVIKNKFPALQDGVCGTPHRVGLYYVHGAFGFHELVITRDHERHFAQFTDTETAEVLQVYRERYKVIAQDECGDYVSIFHNHGRAAGASVAHSHSQILSTPIIPPEVIRSVQGADEYYQQHGIELYQSVIDWERSQGSRVVYENELFIAFCPFVSRAGYEVRIFPKYKAPRFEASSDAQLLECARALTTVLRKLFIALDDVDYNFYIHTAPVQKDPLIEYDFYRWHIVVTPRIPIAAGFELSTAIYINPFDPDDAAKHLRDTEV